MRSALLISLLFHVSIYLISVRIVRFSRVKYVPRQVYAVSLFSMEEAKNLSRKEEPRPTVRRTPVVEPSQPKEEPAPPPEKTKPKKKKKHVKKKAKKKLVPSSEVRNDKPETSGTRTRTGGSPGVATGDMNLDTENFPFGYYLVTMRRKIAGYWDVPLEASQSKRFCKIYFRVEKSGRITGSSVESSSGSFLFDQAALRAVLQASPLPPLPGDFNEDYLGVHFSFAYEER